MTAPMTTMEMVGQQLTEEIKRFTHVENPKSLEQSLNAIMWGSKRIKVNIARYQHRHAKATTYKPNATTFKQPPSNQHTHTSNRKTFRDTLTTSTTPNITQPPPPPTPIIIHSCPDLTSTLSHYFVGELFTMSQKPIHKTSSQTLHCYLASKPCLIGPTHSISTTGSLFHSIEGLPPQAWHEAAFTRIAGIWGEVIFRETYNPNNNNLVAGKVCIQTKCMEIIQHNMPVIVDNTHVCVRIREIQGECDEILPLEKNLQTDSDIESTDNNDNVDYEDEENKGEDEDVDEDLFDEGTDGDLFCNELNEVFKYGGGWIQEVNKGEASNSIRSSEFDNIRHSQPEYSNSPEYIKSQSSPTGSSKTGKCPLDKTPNFVPNTQIEEKSHSTQSIGSSSTGTVDSTGAFVDLETCDKKYESFGLTLLDDPTSVSNFPSPHHIERNTNRLNHISSNLGPTGIHSPLRIIPMCYMRIRKSLNPTTNNLNNKVDKTIEVGSSIGYEMQGKEIDVRRIIGDEIINQ
ncbi:hypothetical protein Tco_1235827 [Tanacetum coccineum]